VNSKILFLLLLLPATLLAGDLYTGQPPTPYQYQYQDSHTAQWGVVRQRERDTQRDLDRLYQNRNWDIITVQPETPARGLPELWIR